MWTIFMIDNRREKKTRVHTTFNFWVSKGSKIEKHCLVGITVLIIEHFLKMSYVWFVSLATVQFPRNAVVNLHIIMWTIVGLSATMFCFEANHSSFIQKSVAVCCYSWLSQFTSLFRILLLFFLLLSISSRSRWIPSMLILVSILSDDTALFEARLENRLDSELTNNTTDKILEHNEQNEYNVLQGIPRKKSINHISDIEQISHIVITTIHIKINMGCECECELVVVVVIALKTFLSSS